jgi:hypothetical protein
VSPSTRCRRQRALLLDVVRHWTEATDASKPPRRTAGWLQQIMVTALDSSLCRSCP